MPNILSTGQKQQSSRAPADISNGQQPVAFPNAPMTPTPGPEQSAPAVVNKSLPAGSFTRGPESRY